MKNNIAPNAAEVDVKGMTAEKMTSVKHDKSIESFKSSSESKIPVRRETEEFVPSVGTYVSTIPDPKAENCDPLFIDDCLYS